MGGEGKGIRGGEGKGIRGGKGRALGEEKGRALWEGKGRGGAREALWMAPETWSWSIISCLLRVSSNKRPFCSFTICVYPHVCNVCVCVCVCVCVQCVW